MNDELTNLLPVERREHLAHEYRFRFGVVVLSFFIMLVLVSAVLLAPTYIFLSAVVSAKEARLADMKSMLSSSDGVQFGTRLAALSKNTTTLLSLGNKPSVSALMRSALQVSHPGIALASFSYAPVSGKTQNALMISGVAATRDALRTYQLALLHAPFVRAADLPVSAYAKDANIAFTITITLAP